MSRSSPFVPPALTVFMVIFYLLVASFSPLEYRYLPNGLMVIVVAIDSIVWIFLRRPDPETHVAWKVLEFTCSSINIFLSVTGLIGFLMFATSPVKFLS